MGDDAGVSEIANEFKVRHFPYVQCNKKGTPLISSMLELARANSESPFLCIINTDIILLPGIIQAVRDVARQVRDFVLVGQRWDVAITNQIPGIDFYPIVQKLIRDKGRLHPPMGSDYFLFPRTCYTKIPDFAIGRAGWDNWMIYHARYSGWKVIDATHDIHIVHQDHDYAHLKDGQPHYRQPETQVNVQLAGGEHTIYTIHDAQKKLVDGEILSIPITWKRFWRQVEISPATLLKSQLLSRIFYGLFHPRKTYIKMRHSIKLLLKGS